MKKKLYVYVGISLFFVVSLLVIPLFFKKQITSTIIAQINQRVNAVVAFDHASVTVFRHFPNLTLTLHELSVLGKDKFSADTLTSVKKMRIEISLKTLILGKAIEVKSINLVEPVIDLVVLSDSSSNYDIFIEDTSSVADSSSAFAVKLDKVLVTDANIRYKNELSKTYLNMLKLNYEGTGDFEEEIFLLTTQMEVQELTVDYNKVRYLDEKYIQLHSTFDVNSKNKKITIKENNFQINHFKIGVKGSLTLLKEGYDFNLDFSTPETQFENILSIVPGIYLKDLEQIETSGKLAFNGFVKGVYDDSLNKIPSFQLDLKVEDGMFKVDTLSTAIRNIQLDLLIRNTFGVLDSTCIDLKTFHMDLGKHPVHGRALIQGLKNPLLDIDVTADLQLADLEKIYPIKDIAMQGELNFRLHAKGKYVSELGIKQIPSFNLNLAFKDGKLKYDSLPVPIDNIQLQLVASNNTGNPEHSMVDCKNIKFNIGKNPVHGFFKTEGYQAYKLEADLKASIDLMDIEKSFPIKDLQLKGTLDVDVQANGTYDKAHNTLPAIDAKVNLIDGYIKSTGYPEPIENIMLKSEVLNATGKMEDTRFNIANFTYTLEGEPFSIQGSIRDMNKYAYDLTIKGLIDLEKITKIYPIPGYELAGLIQSDIKSSGTIADLEEGRYDKIYSSGKVEVKNFRAKSDQIKQKIKITDALFTFTPAKIVIERLEGKIGRSHITMTGDLFNYVTFLTNSKERMLKVDMQVTCDTLDLNEWLSNSTNGTSKTSTVETITADTSAHAEIDIWEVPKNLDFTFDSKIGIVKYEDMIITKMDGEVRIKDGILSMTETGFNTLDAVFNLSGDYNTVDIKHPLFDFNMKIQELDINRAYKELKLVRDLVPAAADAYGVVSIDYSIKGELDQTMYPKMETLVGGGEVRIAQAKLDGMKIFDEISKASKKAELNNPHLKDVVIDTEIRDNRIFVKPFSLKISGFDIDIQGVSDISGTINYLVEIELFPIEKLKIPCHVTGTYDNPKVILGKGKSSN